jgi:hypothetical protein
MLKSVATVEMTAFLRITFYLVTTIPSECHPERSRRGFYELKQLEN